MMLRLELLKVKADLERELEDFVLNCSKCGLDVHWVSDSGLSWPLGAPGASAARRAEAIAMTSEGPPSLAGHRSPVAMVPGMASSLVHPAGPGW